MSEKLEAIKKHEKMIAKLTGNRWSRARHIQKDLGELEILIETHGLWCIKCSGKNIEFVIYSLNDTIVTLCEQCIQTRTGKHILKRLTGDSEVVDK